MKDEDVFSNSTWRNEKRTYEKNKTFIFNTYFVIHI